MKFQAASLAGLVRYSMVFIDGMVAGAAAFNFAKGNIDIVAAIFCFVNVAMIFVGCMIDPAPKTKETFSVTIFDGVLGNEIPEADIDAVLYGTSDDGSSDKIHRVEIEWDD